MTNPLQHDLDQILTHTEGLWEELRGQRLFITGGTGFFGCWLLESFCWANDKLGLGAKAVVLTRDPERFKRKAPHLTRHPAVQLHTGDVRTFDFPAGTFSHVIHAAAEADTALNRSHPLETLDLLVNGTRRAVEFADKANTRSLLLTSSGAVYGPQPPDMLRIPEDYSGAPNVLHAASAYGEGKRAAELIAFISSQQTRRKATIVRGFSFVGPHLPLDGSFAVGNFVRDALRGGPIVVTGDGTTRRSYLYGADLAIWLWTMLFKGRDCCVYNVGSENEVSMAELATIVAAEAANKCDIKTMQKPHAGAPVSRYTPDTRRARTDLGLSEHVPLRDGIRRMLEYERNRQ